MDRHTFRSTPSGIDEFGRMLFENGYTDLGLLLHNYKYNNKPEYLQTIVSAIGRFLEKKNFAKDANYIIPVPPTSERKYQPVIEITKAVSKLSGIPYKDVLFKKPGLQAKNMSSYDRLDDKILFKGLIPDFSNILIIDDIYHTGRTLNECVRVLRQLCYLEKIYVLTITRTKRLGK